jgi:hypothetical protein
MNTKSALFEPDFSPYPLYTKGLGIKLPERTIPVYNVTPQKHENSCTCYQICSFSCPLHWTQFSEQRFQEIELAISDKLVYYRARFDYPDIYDPEKSSNLFLKYTRSLSKKYCCSHFVWVNHIQGIDLHRHYLFGYPEPVDEEWCKNRYRRLCDKYCWQPLGAMGLMFERCTSPKGWLKYSLGIGKKHLGLVRAPWIDYHYGTCLKTNVCDGSMLYNLNRAIKH